MPAWLEDYAISTDDALSDEDIINFSLYVDYNSVSFAEAGVDSHWIKAMNGEIHLIEKNNTWELTNLPSDKKPIRVKWVYMTKYKTNEEVDRFQTQINCEGL